MSEQITPTPATILFMDGLIVNGFEASQITTDDGPTNSHIDISGVASTKSFFRIQKNFGFFLDHVIFTEPPELWIPDVSAAVAEFLRRYGT